MSPEEKVVPIKRAAKKEPKTEAKKTRSRKVKKPAIEVGTEHTGGEIPLGHEGSTETEVVQTDVQTDKQDSPSHKDSSSALVAETLPTVPLTGDELIEEAVKYINEKANQALYMGSVKIGFYILEHFYGNDIDRARSRNPVKPISYRLLCEHPDLAVRSETLGVMVRVAAQEAFFLASKLKTEGLSYSHRAELVKIVDDDVRVMLVHRVLEESLSVRQLAELVTQERKGIVSEDKPIGTYLERMINSSEKLFEDPRREALINDETRRKEQLKSLKGKTRRRLLEKVDDVMEKTKEWTKLYEGLKRDLEEIEEEKRTKKS